MVAPSDYLVNLLCRFLDENRQAPDQFISTLQKCMVHISPIPTRQKIIKSFIQPELFQDACMHAFVRHDVVRRPLQPPYDGSFKSISKAANFLVLDIKGKHKSVSKSAHILPQILHEPTVAT